MNPKRPSSLTLLVGLETIWICLILLLLRNLFDYSLWVPIINIRPSPPDSSPSSITGSFILFLLLLLVVISLSALDFGLILGKRWAWKARLSLATFFMSSWPLRGYIFSPWERLLAYPILTEPEVREYFGSPQMPGPILPTLPRTKIYIFYDIFLLLFILLVFLIILVVSWR